VVAAADSEDSRQRLGFAKALADTSKTKRGYLKVVQRFSEGMEAEATEDFLAGVRE
jgi:hypothetical protein